jgi:hypothetical protein
MYGETEDVRGGMGLEGAAEFQKFVESGGVLLTLGTSTYFPPEFGITRSVDAQRAQTPFYAPGPILQTEILQPAHPIFYGYASRSLPVLWSDGPLLQMPEAATGPGRNSPPAPDSREKPIALMRFVGGDSGVLSGLMRGADQIRNRPAIVDVPSGRGRVLLYVTNPIYRWQNFGEHNLVFNALLFYNDLPHGPPQTPTTTATTSGQPER